MFAEYLDYYLLVAECNPVGRITVVVNRCECPLASSDPGARACAQTLTFAALGQDRRMLSLAG